MALAWSLGHMGHMPTDTHYRCRLCGHVYQDNPLIWHEVYSGDTPYGKMVAWVARCLVCRTMPLEEITEVEYVAAVNVIEWELDLKGERRARGGDVKWDAQRGRRNRH